MKHLLILLVFFMTSPVMKATEKWFQGYQDTNWNNVLNWDGGVPVSGDDVRIFAPCILDNDNSLSLNSLQVGVGGAFTLTANDTILINNTIAKSYLFYALDIFGNATIDGSIQLINSIEGGARLGNVILNGSLEIDTITSGPEAALVYNFTLNGSFIIGNNINVVADYSLLVSGNCDINMGSTLTIKDNSKKAILLNTAGHLTILEPIFFPASMSMPCIDSDGIVINHVELTFTTDGSTFSPTLRNKGNFTNYGIVNMPLTANYSWGESGDFINEECAWINLEGRLFCVNKTAPNPYATITNKGIIHSTYQGMFNHYYGDNHTFNNLEGIAVDARGKFSAPFDLNTGAKLQFLGFSNCGEGSLNQFYEGSLDNINSSNLFLDTLLTMQAGTYDEATNKMLLTTAALGKNKFFVELSDADAPCSITTPVLLDDFLEIVSFYADSDEDGFGDINDVKPSCSLSVAGYVDNDEDCNDGDPGINPDASEACDGIDSNCDGIGENPGDEEAVSNSFSGTIDNDWYKVGNWSENEIPDFCTDVTIPDGQMVSLNSFTDTIKGLYIEPNAQLDLQENLTIYPYGNTGLINEGILFGPDVLLTIECKESSTGIENADSIYIGGIVLKNMIDGIYNYEDGSIETHTLDLDRIEFLPISNEGLLQLTKAMAPSQSLILLTNLEEEGIYNFGSLIWEIDYNGGNESESGIPYFIQNIGELRINGNFSYVSQNGSEGIYNEGKMVVSGEVYLPASTEFVIDGEVGAELTIKSGGKLTLTEQN